MHCRFVGRSVDRCVCMCLTATMGSSCRLYCGRRCHQRYCCCFIFAVFISFSSSYFYVAFCEHTHTHILLSLSAVETHGVYPLHFIYCKTTRVYLLHLFSDAALCLQCYCCCCFSLFFQQ